MLDQILQRVSNPILVANNDTCTVHFIFRELLPAGSYKHSAIPSVMMLESLHLAHEKGILTSYVRDSELAATLSDIFEVPIEQSSEYAGEELPIVADDILLICQAKVDNPKTRDDFDYIISMCVELKQVA